MMIEVINAVVVTVHVWMGISVLGGTAIYFAAMRGGE
jgi:hypothetical protein